MAKPSKIKQLETLAREMVGDGQAPELFFVTDQGVVTTITRDFSLAYRDWQSIARSGLRRECALEDRRFGCIASVEPEEDGSSKLVVRDDSADFKKFYPHLVGSIRNATQLWSRT